LVAAIVLRARRQLGGPDRLLLQRGRGDRVGQAGVHAARVDHPAGDQQVASGRADQIDRRAVLAIDRWPPSARDTGTPKRARSEQTADRRPSRSRSRRPRWRCRSRHRRDRQALDPIDHQPSGAVVDAVVAVVELAELCRSAANAPPDPRMMRDAHSLLAHVACFDEGVYISTSSRCAQAIQRHNRNGFVEVPATLLTA
jgi:hypothetical protein